MGDPDEPHSYSYTPDVAAGLITLGTQPGATGTVWHLPVAPARSTRQIIDDVYRLAGQRPRSFAAGGTTLTLLGLVKPAMREYLHTLYQFTDRWVVDDSKFRTAFGGTSHRLDEALARHPAVVPGRRRDRRARASRPLAHRFADFRPQIAAKHPEVACRFDPLRPQQRRTP